MMKSLEKSMEKELYCDMPSMPYYPTFYVDSTQMPDIDEWEVGEEYTITVKVKMIAYSMNENEKKTRSSADFQMIEYAKKTPKSLS